MIAATSGNMGTEGGGAFSYDCRDIGKYGNAGWGGFSYDCRDMGKYGNGGWGRVQLFVRGREGVGVICFIRKIFFF